jgi:putative transcriptional regulator
MGRMFDLLKEGLEEAIAYERGLSKNVRVKKKKRIDVNAVSEQPQEYQPSDRRNLRKRLAKTCADALL